MHSLAIRQPGHFKIFEGQSDLYLIEEGGDINYVINNDYIRARSLSRWTAISADWFVYPHNSTDTWLYNGVELMRIQLIGRHLKFDTSTLDPDLISQAPRYVQSRVPPARPSDDRK